MATEKRLIDAADWDSFYADMGDSRNTMDSYDRGYTDALDRVDDWMDAQPTVDAVEVVHGHWVRKQIGKYTGTDEVVCSCCRYFIAVTCSDTGFKEAIKGMNYCPNCGAKMDGDGNGT